MREAENVCNSHNTDTETRRVKSYCRIVKNGSAVKVYIDHVRDKTNVR